MVNVLRDIVARRRARYGVIETAAVPPSSRGQAMPPSFERSGQPFLNSLAARRGHAIIAEIKLGSPTLGSLADRVDPEGQAEAYARAGAAALSVVVEPDFFFGGPEVLARAKSAANLPTIAKDFVVHPRQLDEAVDAGADAVLLIASLYRPDELVYWAGLARARGMVPLVEMCRGNDFTLLDGSSWELVGVNNRDLRTFEVDLERSIAMRRLLPESALAVAESGISSAAEIARLRSAGFDAFLIGESLLLAPDPAAKLEELLA